MATCAKFTRLACYSREFVEASHIFLENGLWRVSASLASPRNTARRVWRVRATRLGECRQVWRVCATRLGECRRVWRVCATRLGECRRVWQVTTSTRNATHPRVLTQVLATFAKFKLAKFTVEWPLLTYKPIFWINGSMMRRRL